MPRFIRPLIVVALSLAALACSGDSPTAPTPPPAPVATSITLSQSSASLTAVGQTVQLTATVKDQNGAAMAGLSVTWSSSDGSVVSVANGLVTALKPGVANVSAAYQSLQASASVTASDGVKPTVTSITYDGASNDDLAPGKVELYGLTKLEVNVSDDYDLKGVAVFLESAGTNVLIGGTEELSGKERKVGIDWKTYETTTIGGVDTLWVLVWDSSENETLMGEEIVLMNQPEITVNNLLVTSVTFGFTDMSGDSTYDAIVPPTVLAPGKQVTIRGAFLSTDSVQLTWEGARESIGSGDYRRYLGVNIGGTFVPRDMTDDRTYEIDNVVGETTYYVPQWYNAEANFYEAEPVMDLGLISEWSVCRDGLTNLRCTVAAGASGRNFGYYELETTSRVGYYKISSGFRVGGSWYWSPSQILSRVADGSGAIRLDVTFAASQAVPPSSQAPAATASMRIPGALSDDRPVTHRKE